MSFSLFLLRCTKIVNNGFHPLPKKKKQFSRFDVSFDELYMEGRLDEPIPPVEELVSMLSSSVAQGFLLADKKAGVHRSMWTPITMVN